MNLSAVLLALATPLARQVMVGLGFSVVTFTGVDLAVTGLLDQARQAWAGALSADVVAYLAMAGVHDGLAMMAGAIAGRVAVMSMSNFRLAVGG